MFYLVLWRCKVGRPDVVSSQALSCFLSRYSLFNAIASLVFKESKAPSLFGYACRDIFRTSRMDRACKVRRQLQEAGALGTLGRVMTCHSMHRRELMAGEAVAEIDDLHAQERARDYCFVSTRHDSSRHRVCVRPLRWKRRTRSFQGSRQPQL